MVQLASLSQLCVSRVHSSISVHPVITVSEVGCTEGWNYAAVLFSVGRKNKWKFRWLLSKCNIVGLIYYQSSIKIRVTRLKITTIAKVNTVKLTELSADVLCVWLTEDVFIST